MSRGSQEFVFVGAAEGVLRAFRISGENRVLVPAGVYRCRSLSFFALGEQTQEGEIWLFVSGKASLEVLLYSPKSDSFRNVAAVVTAGSGTHVSVSGGIPEAPGCQSVFLAHYHQHCVSAFRFCAQQGFSEEVLLEPGMNAHQARARGAFLYVPCLGSDHIAQYRLVEEPGPAPPRLHPLEKPHLDVPGGPRHMAFLPHTSKALVLCELASRLDILEIGSDGQLERQDSAAIFTHTDKGAHWSSDVVVRPDGAFAYAINRNPAEIVAFSITPGGVLQRSESLALSAPVRSFAMAPDCSHLQVGGEDGVLHAISSGPKMEEISSLAGLGAIRHTEVVFLGAANSGAIS